MSDDLRRLVENAIAEQTRPGAGNETPPIITVSQWTPATRCLIADVLVNAKALLDERDERRRLGDALALAAPPGVGDDFDRVAELARIATDAIETDRLRVQAQERARELDAELARRRTEVHDLRNVAGGLIGYLEVLLLHVREVQAELAKSGSPPDPELDEDIRMAQEAITTSVARLQP